MDIESEEPDDSKDEECKDNNKNYKNKLKNLDSNNIELKLKEINTSNIYDNIPPKFFNIKEAKVVDKKSIILNSNKNDENAAYEYSITFLGKKYYRMTNKKDIELYDNIYYYCTNHRTLKNSNERNSKGNPKRVGFCNARIIYNKENDEYYTDWGHSSLCNKEQLPEYENKAEIEKEINNYNELKETLLSYLNKNSMVTYKKFLKIAYKTYETNQCNFKIDKNTFKNMYYNWRKNSMSFTKYSALQNPLTNDKESYLRDYSYITLYNKSGKSQFMNEHFIFISNYFIKKLRQALHIYIDGTFLYPPGFAQLTNLNLSQ